MIFLLLPGTTKFKISCLRHINFLLNNSVLENSDKNLKITNLLSKIETIPDPYFDSEYNFPPFRAMIAVVSRPSSLSVGITSP